MTDADRLTASRVNRALWAIAAALVLWATVAVSEVYPWGFARPPAEACRSVGQRPTPQTQHLQLCPAVERRAKETTA